MTMFETIFLILVMLLLAFSMRVVAEQQRIAVYRLGRYAGLKGPGIVMVVPVMDRSCLIAIGDRGVLMNDGTGRFKEFRIPVEFHNSIPADSPIRVVSFTKDKLLVAQRSPCFAEYQS